MIDPKSYFIKRTSVGVAKKLSSNAKIKDPEINFLKSSVIDIENFFNITLSVSQICCAHLMYLGYFAEMATGEGKTYATLLAASWLHKKGIKVHILTQNEYLSYRDFKESMSYFKFIGAKSSIVNSDTENSEKYEIYNADIVYTTPSCVAFDRMKETFKVKNDELFQGPLDNIRLLVDEIDALLIENGSVPFIASKEVEAKEKEWRSINEWCKSLGDLDVYFDPDSESTMISDTGYKSLENHCAHNELIPPKTNLYKGKNSGLIHKASMSVRAHYDFKLGREYIISENTLRIINQSTGRIEKNRKWGAGLHQAIEIKHNLPISSESEIQSKITVPELLLLYKDFSGTSATISHRALEIFKRYGKITVKVDRDKKDNRTFHEDELFEFMKDKDASIIKEIKKRNRIGQPILIGTESINEARKYSKLLTNSNIPHQTLTAEEEFREAEIISQAGIPGRVTIATNMAGRGTDIRLGGGIKELEEEAINKGGLFILSTTRQLERRLDDQLAGRTGRQGSVGEVKFYISFEDDLFKDQEKLPRFEYLNKKSIKKYQNTSANKIGIAREEIDNLNSSLIIQTELFLDIRSHWLKSKNSHKNKDIINVFIKTIRNLLNEHSVYKKGVYADYEGFCEDLKSYSNSLYHFLLGLNDKYTSYELCAEVEKSTILYLNSKLEVADIKEFTESLLDSFDSLWSEHLILIEQIYDHSNWQSFVQKNTFIQFSILSCNAFKSFIESMEFEFFKCVEEKILNG